jgi:hypothetical protein
MQKALIATKNFLDITFDLRLIILTNGAGLMTKYAATEIKKH